MTAVPNQATRSRFWWQVVSVAATMILVSGILVGEPVVAQLPVVEVEEEVYRLEPANNGAGPMWCFGNTCIVRSGEHVLASGLHTLEGARPLNNCVPSLLLRDESGWNSVYRSPGRTREPSPLAVFPGSSVFLSVNPTTTSPDVYSGPSQPGVEVFRATSPSDAPRLVTPRWDGTPQFTEHSYRSFVADAASRELILLQNIDYTHAEWSFCRQDGQWSACGKLYWPRDAQAGGGPVRVCYPTVALKDRRVFVCGVSDIVEPNRQWRAYKHEQTGREWDYVFRHLYFTWSDDITTGKFHDWIEVANCESTAGSIFPNDLYVNANGDVSLLWHETSIDNRLRDRFFPSAKQRHTLRYAVVRGGEVLHRKRLIDHEEGVEGTLPGRGRFHVTPAGQLWVICHVNDVRGEGTSGGRNQLMLIGPDGTPDKPIPVPLRHPMHSFYTNTVRAGCLPTTTLDVFGQVGQTMRYARIKLP